MRSPAPLGKRGHLLNTVLFVKRSFIPEIGKERAQLLWQLSRQAFALVSMGNCCVSTRNQKQLSRRPKDSNNVLNGSDKHSPSVGYISASKTAPSSYKKKQSAENGSSQRQDSYRRNNSASNSYPPQSQDAKRMNFKPEFTIQNIETLFNKYKDKNADCILAHGTEELCKDLDLDPTEFRVLLLAWKFDVSEMCRFTRKEFVNGCTSLRVDSIAALKSKLAIVEQEIANKELFKDLYRFTYGFGLDVEDGQRTLPTPEAIDLWRLVFSKSGPIFLDEWFNFLNENQVKGISRDTWNMFLHLSDTVNPDFSNYDESEAWPSLFDEFVAKRFEEAGSDGQNKKDEE